MDCTCVRNAGRRTHSRSLRRRARTSDGFYPGKKEGSAPPLVVLSPGSLRCILEASVPSLSAAPHRSSRRPLLQRLRRARQANTGGGLRGTVVDKTGAGIATGKAVLINQGTNLTFQSTLSKQGEYNFSSIPPGTYVLTIESTGFETERYDQVVINLNEVKSLNSTLVIGSSSTTVDVSTQSVNIVTQETSVTGLFTEQQIKDLPLNGRDYQSLVFLSPGISRSASGTGQGSGVVSAGTRPTNNNYLIDGGDANDPVVPSGTVGASGSAISAVPLDALGEFTVISSNASAEFGRSSGAVVNVVTKSGTNQIHGTVWEFIRNTSVNTRGFFDPIGRKSPFKSNQFGVRIGAPLWKDHTFISFAYEGFRQRANFQSNLTTPTTAAIAAISNPALRALFAATYPSATSSNGSAFTTLPRTYTSNLDGDTGFVRFDHAVTKSNQAVLTGSILDSINSPRGSGLLPGTGTGSTGRPYHFTFSDTQVISSHLINLGRLTFQRQALSFIGESATAAQLASGTARTSGPFAGLPYSPSIGDPNGIPTLSSNNGNFTTVGTASNYPQGRVSNTIGVADAFTWEKGRHNIKFGGEYRRIQENGAFSNAIRPVITLDDSTTARFNTGAILSQSQSFYLTGSSERGFRQNEQAYFAQDSWRATPTLTFEFGLRYEIFSPFSESKNLLNNAYVLDSNNRPQACTPLPFGAGFNTVALINPSRYGIKPFCPDYNNFGPRIGFSYDVLGSGKTVLSGAWGVFYDRLFDNVYGNSRFNAPQVAPITTNASTTPATAFYDGAQASGTISTTQVYTATTLDPSLRTPYTQHFNLTVSRELDKNTSITAAYVGGIGTKLLATETPNFGNSFPNSFRPSNQGVLARSQADIAAGIIRGPFSTFSHRTSNAASNFHSFEATLKRRLSYGLNGQVAYTFAHSMDNISDEIVGNTDSANPQSTLDNLLLPYLSPGSPCPTSQVAAAQLTASTITSDTVYTGAIRCATGNPALTTAQAATLFNQSYTRFRPIGYNYGDSSFDVRHRLAVSVNYELPFGRGKMFGSNANAITNQVVGGWHLGSIVDTQTGTPYIVVTGVDSNRDGNTNDRAIITQVGTRNPSLTKNFTNSSGPTVSRFGCNTTASPAIDPVTRSRTCAAGSGTITFNQGIGVSDPTLRMHRGSLREPGIFNWDAQLFKNFKVRELATVRFSADAFNVLNHTNFGVFTNTITSLTFARSNAQRSLGNTQSRQLQLALKVDF